MCDLFFREPYRDDIKTRNHMTDARCSSYAATGVEADARASSAVPQLESTCLRFACSVPYRLPPSCPHHRNTTTATTPFRKLNRTYSTFPGARRAWSGESDCRRQLQCAETVACPAAHLHSRATTCWNIVAQDFGGSHGDREGRNHPVA